ncbi:MAG TPA: EscU/YscU/HrcU family type III secretion system export apparatus switch protein [Bacilli bacterium]
MKIKRSEAAKRLRAVALKYDKDKHEAPIVTAKGHGVVAENMIKKAREHGVPVQENPSLAELLSKLDIDQAIPPELYRLVAELLSYIYRMDKKARDFAARSNP